MPIGNAVYNAYASLRMYPSFAYLGFRALVNEKPFNEQEGLAATRIYIHTRLRYRFITPIHYGI